VKTNEGSYEYDLLLFDHPISAPPEFADVAVDKGFVPVDRETLKGQRVPRGLRGGRREQHNESPKNGPQLTSRP
jgi:hypothetical protein